MQKQKAAKSKVSKKQETFALNFPFEFEGEKVEQITLRRPTVLDLEAIEEEASGITKSIGMLSNLSGLTPDAIRRLDAADFNRINEGVLDFLELHPVK